MSRIAHAIVAPFAGYITEQQKVNPAVAQVASDAVRYSVLLSLLLGMLVIGGVL